MKKALFKDLLVRNTLLSGLFIYAICIISVYFNLGWALLYFLLFAPGAAYGIAVSPAFKKRGQPTTFVFVAIVIYVAMLFIAGIYKLQFTPLRVIAASTVGSVVTLLAYHYLITKSLPALKLLIGGILVGVVSAIPSAISCYYMQGYSFDQIIDTMISAGFYSIFPLWQLLFTIFVANHPIYEKHE
jgi:hypothetical protein